MLGVKSIPQWKYAGLKSDQTLNYALLRNICPGKLIQYWQLALKVTFHRGHLFTLYVSDWAKKTKTKKHQVTPEYFFWPWFQYSDSTHINWSSPHAVGEASGQKQLSLRIFMVLCNWLPPERAVAGSRPGLLCTHPQTVLCAKCEGKKQSPVSF